MAVVVLKALAHESSPSGGCAHDEAAAALVRQRPELVAGPLEAEHGVEDVERDERHAVRGVGRRRHLQ